jgi:hypothetical protein
MATQLKHTDFAYTPAPTPRPIIRVAFIAGEATTAVHDAMAKLPADTRDGTLEDLVWDQGVAPSTDVAMIQSMTCSLIEAARGLLSPRMYSAFLRWGEAASHASSFYESDEEGAIRSASAAEARGAVSRIAAENLHDMAFVMLLAGIETADAPTFGPLNRRFADFDVNGGDLLRRICFDLRKFSPIPDLVNEVSARAWKASKSKSAISADIGRAITSAFSFARGEDVSHLDARAPYVVVEGCDPFMRDPLIQWQRAYARYEEARDALSAYDRDVHTPTFAGTDVADEVADQVQEQYDDLLMAEHHAIEQLYRIPAPSGAELAIKLKIFERAEGWTLTNASKAIRRIAIDARRCGRHGAHLQTDSALLAAFSDRRHEFEATDGVDLSGEQEDAYFRRVDAAEAVLINNRATTVEGVLAKLRVAFVHQTGDDWSDLAISDTNRSKFTDGLALSDMYTRLAWSAIKDLACIAGVSLAEQGA